jgi:hypothetical protein
MKDKSAKDKDTKVRNTDESGSMRMRKCGRALSELFFLFFAVYFT